MPNQGPANWKPSTLAAQALGLIEPATKAVVAPLHLTTTFIRDADNQYRAGYAYGRPDNATTRHAEAVLAVIEKAHEAALFASGMAAATAIVLSLSEPSHILASEVMYWAFRHWLRTEAVRLGHKVDFVDSTDPAALSAAIKPGTTKLVYIETPGNPLWTISDIAAIAALAHDAGALLAVDSTVATPIFTRPLELGADLVMHSASKYLNGHSDVIAGMVATARAGEAWDRIKAVRTQFGAVLGPFEAWLLLRGLRTLEVRVKRQAASAMLLATRLANHGRVAQVLYPGLPEHSGHDVAQRQMRGGFGAMLSVRVKGGESAAIAAAARVQLWKRATSLGGVESLIEHRASVEGANSPCPPDLLRLSVGLEDPDDLMRDLDQALMHGP
ncbi:MAG TPA: PLP-dependent aspartate aminotransferase family protein [Xanthobacteraceae bacterium]|jgi:cystathionine gamma-synthase|nr:PLP-dependent aspartate aminotransferase family protein [Xanthobacteraceae bacterium]